MTHHFTEGLGIPKHPLEGHTGGAFRTKVGFVCAILGGPPLKVTRPVIGACVVIGTAPEPSVTVTGTQRNLVVPLLPP